MNKIYVEFCTNQSVIIWGEKWTSVDPYLLKKMNEKISDDHLSITRDKIVAISS